MKIRNCGWDGWLTKRRVALCIVSLICLLAGSYLVGRYFALLVIVLLGTAGLLVGRVVGASRMRNKIDGTDTAVRLKNGPQVTLAWDYRPKRAIERETAFEWGGAGTAEVVSPSALNENDNVWFNFTKAEPAAGRGGDKAPLLGNARAGSTYDQSPIDNQCGAAE
jgi:hypothetical protein